VGVVSQYIFMEKFDGSLRSYFKKIYTQEELSIAGSVIVQMKALLKKQIFTEHLYCADIKPDNYVYKKQDQGILVKMIDFGHLCSKEPKTQEEQEDFYVLDLLQLFALTYRTIQDKNMISATNQLNNVIITSPRNLVFNSDQMDEYVTYAFIQDPLIKKHLQDPDKFIDFIAAGLTKNPLFSQYIRGVVLNINFLASNHEIARALVQKLEKSDNPIFERTYMDNIKRHLARSALKTALGITGGVLAAKLLRRKYKKHKKRRSGSPKKNSRRKMKRFSQGRKMKRRFSMKKKLEDLPIDLFSKYNDYLVDPELPYLSKSINNVIHRTKKTTNFYTTSLSIQEVCEQEFCEQDEFLKIILKPDGSLKYPNLQELNIQETDITELPSNLNKLKLLNCGGVKTLTELPQNLNNLIYLNCSGTNLIKLPPNLNNLRVLDISFTRVTELPENLNNLKNLSISGTNITELPQNLNNLVILDMRSNRQITRLPPLHNLKELICSRTSITELPETLNKLEMLDIEYTQIKELPQNLNNLKALAIFDTLITELPQNLNNLQRLSGYRTQIKLPQNLIERKSNNLLIVNNYVNDVMIYMVKLSIEDDCYFPDDK